MRTILLTLITCLLSITTCSVAQDVTGFWKIPNDKTGQAECVVCIYTYQGMAYGRIIATLDHDGQLKDSIYKASEVAPGVQGNLPYAGLDIIWELKPQGNKFIDGKILDPQKGKLYGADIWVEGENLILRGKLWIFGANRTWYPLREGDLPEGFLLPDLATLTPSIPRVKGR